ncbi:MAG: hypothetical protein LC800_18990 [Acidobacteria bacterium]|nr:hypothetical protein [Acidobacteriota bacterium]
MKTQRLAIAITLLNLALLMFLLAQIRRAGAHDVAPVLRGRALEIVDAQGRVRASITVQPPVSVDSKMYPETVLLRMTDPKSGPVVKLTATEEGSALGLSDDSRGGVQVYARGTGSFLRVVDRSGREQVIKP